MKQTPSYTHVSFSYGAITLLSSLFPLIAQLLSNLGYTTPLGLVFVAIFLGLATSYIIAVKQEYISRLCITASLVFSALLLPPHAAIMSMLPITMIWSGLIGAGSYFLMRRIDPQLNLSRPVKLGILVTALLAVAILGGIARLALTRILNANAL